LEINSLKQKTPPMIFGGVHKKDSKITFFTITKQILFVRAEHRRRARCAANFASLQFD